MEIEIMLLYIVLPILIFMAGYLIGARPIYYKDVPIRHIKFRNGKFQLEYEYAVMLPEMKKVTILSLNTVKPY